MELFLIIIIIVALMRFIFANNELGDFRMNRYGGYTYTEPNAFKKFFVGFARVIALFILIIIILSCCSTLL